MGSGDPPGPSAGIPRYRSAALALLAVWVVYLVPIWAAPVLPFVDLPWHLSSATVVRNYGAPGNDFAEIYTLKLFPRPNVLHLAFTAARLFPNVEVGNRIFYSLYALAVPGLLLLIIRAFRGNGWFALLGFLFLYNFSTNYGFTEFTAGIPIVLLALYALALHHRRPTAGSTFAAMAALALLYFAHAMAAVFGILFAIAYAVARPRKGWGDALAQTVIPLPALLLMIAWNAEDPGGGVRTHPLGWLLHYYRHRFVVEWPMRLVDLFTLDNRALFGPSAGRVAAAAFAGVVLVPLAYGAIAAWREPERQRLRLGDRRLPLFAFIACAAALCLAAPPGIPPYWNFYQRFTAMGLLGAIVLGSTIERRILPERAFRAAVVVVVAVHAASWGEHILTFGKEARDFAAVLPEPRPGGVLCPVVKDVSYYRGEPEVFTHFADYYTVWRLGVVAARFGAGSSAVWRKVGPERLPKVADCVQSSAVDHAVVRADAVDGSLERLGFVLERERGEWLLYRRSGGGGPRS